MSANPTSAEQIITATAPTTPEGITEDNSITTFDVGNTEQPQETQTETQETQQENPDKEAIEQLSQQVGYDLSSFPDLKSAQAAHKMLLEQYAQAAQPAQPQPQPQPSFQDDLDEDEEDDSFEEDDELEDEITPKSKKKEKPTKRERQLEKELKKLKRQQEQAEQQRQQALFGEVTNRAARAIEQLGSERYGTSQNRTFAQQSEAQSLFQDAIRLAQGARSHGRQLTIEQAVQAAATLRGDVPTAPKKDAPDPKANVGLEPRNNGNSPSGAPSPNPTAPGQAPLPYGSLTSYTRDPQFQAAVKSLGS